MKVFTHKKLLSADKAINTQDIRSQGIALRSLKRSMIGLVALFLAALACGAPINDRTFHIVAKYRANISGYQIGIETQGVIRAGYDISDNGTADVQITPLPSRTGTPLELEIDASGSATVSIYSMPQTVLNWHEHPQEELRGLLEQSGFENLSEDEIEETVRVIYGALAGS